MIAANAALVVTGSTGRLGSRVASGLSQLGVDQRLVVRNPAKAPSYQALVSRRQNMRIGQRSERR